ncbi:MAG: GNAT family N-acetyltransferase [Gordonia sp. (in: high G+C Gram-positive bacteria)]|uniref:GNAT family N-acetyltransferase n=1 Tax=Gordonia sp. (in: high G+C Gram-positive bacteria) TaxID=84139 RepID=UPI0039E355FF
MRLTALGDLTPAELSEVRSLLDAAFGGEFTDDDFDHALGGTHVLVYRDGWLVGHASVVPRTLRVDDEATAAGYVEGVAVAENHRRHGIGGLLVDRVNGIVDTDYALGALAASREALRLYLAHGWTPWDGPLGVDTDTGWLETPEERGSILVRCTPRGGPVDVSGTLTCDQRSGDDW